MARRIMARRRTPVSRNAAASTYTGPGPEDLLENKLEQLNSLLWLCHGGGDRWREDAGGAHLDNVIWLAYELTREARELLQRSET
jgi:hypothetical protein